MPNAHNQDMANLWQHCRILLSMVCMPLLLPPKSENCYKQSPQAKISEILKQLPCVRIARDHRRDIIKPKAYPSH